MKEVADVALIGMAVMGQNLILNMNDHGFVVCAHNRTIEKVHDFLSTTAKGTNVIGADSMEEMVKCLKKPRKIILLVMAGTAVDTTIDKLIPLLSPGDVIVDGGNSDFEDTQRRYKRITSNGLYFIGTGVSGGEEGARYGPSLMPGGSLEAWPLIQDIFTSISAKAEGEPCCFWMGSDGAGHFVKMVHNGIEYGDMQLICEAYHFLKNKLGMSCDEISAVMDEWNKSELDSYLIEITKHILAYKTQSNEVLVEKIRDTAGQKGTGKWTVINACKLGIPITLIAESVFARCLSSNKGDRIKASKLFPSDRCHVTSNQAEFSHAEKQKLVEDVKMALYASKIVSYAQGFMLLREASIMHDWKLKFFEIAKCWRGGCIIRSKLLKQMSDAFVRNNDLECLLFDEFFISEILRCQASWRRIVGICTASGIPVPAFSAALTFFDGLRCDKLPSNLLQAQRDYFGAHTYELDTEPGKFHHTDWTGTGGNVSASTYQV